VAQLPDRSLTGADDELNISDYVNHCGIFQWQFTYRNDFASKVFSAGVRQDFSWRRMDVRSQTMDTWQPDWMKTDHLIVATSELAAIGKLEPNRAEHGEPRSWNVQERAIKKSDSAHEMRPVQRYETIGSLGYSPIRHESNSEMSGG
jgi:hypothetical protein